MKKLMLFLLLCIGFNAQASIIPIGAENNSFYYKIGGGCDFVLPPVSDTTSVHMDTTIDLGLGNSCSAFNPALSIRNSMNDLKNSLDNLEQSIVVNATGSLIQLPMYLLAQANPTAYHLLNNALLTAHNKIAVSTKSCETIKAQIGSGKNPYKDWATIAVNDQWKQHLSFVSEGAEDINDAKKEIDKRAGDEGVPWVNNANAGGKLQPPVHVISDTMKAGYNAVLNRDLQSVQAAPDGELKKYFPNPKSAALWVRSVVGDQTITTCHDATCLQKQGSTLGHGLLPWVTSCKNNDNCAVTIRDHLAKLVTGNEVISKESLSRVSSDGIVISPEVISSVRSMDDTQQAIIINKLSEEIAMQRVIDKAFMAKNILMTGAQVPVIAANHAAQTAIHRAVKNLDQDVQSLVFEKNVRKEIISDTLSQILDYARQKQLGAMNVASIVSSTPLMKNGSLSTAEKFHP